MSSLAPISDIRELWNDERREFIRQNFCANAPDQYVEPFLKLCEKRGLSPEASHIYLVPRNTKDSDGNYIRKWVPQVSIDGYRLMAARTGQYAGSDEPVYLEGDPYPTKATVTVYKVVQGVRCPFTASAYWSEYYPGEKQGTMWRKMPHVMLAKVAESAALRKAFPEDLSGMYTDAEMDQANTGHVQEATFREVVPEAPQIAPQSSESDVSPAEVVDSTTGEIVGTAEPHEDDRIYDALEAKGEERSRMLKALVNEGVSTPNVDMLRKLIAYIDTYPEAKAILDLAIKRGITDAALPEALAGRTDATSSDRSAQLADKDHLGKGSLTERTRKAIFAEARKHKVSDEDMKAFIKREFGVDSRTELSQEQGEKVLVWVREQA